MAGTQQPDNTPPNARTSEPARSKPGWRRWWPLAVVVLGLVLVFAFDLDRFASFEHLKEHHQRLAAFVAAHRMKAMAIYFVLYVLFVALSLPGAIWFTVAGGFLFGMMAATILAVLAATMGASLLFLATKTSLGDYLHEKAGPWLGKIERGFADNQWSYLLMMRLFPAIPFFVANLVPAFLGASLRAFVVTTLIGIIPATAIFATVGAGLGSVLSTEEHMTLHGMLTAEVKWAMAGLALLAAAPIVYKHICRRRGR